MTQEGESMNSAREHPDRKPSEPEQKGGRSSDTSQKLDPEKAIHLPDLSQR
jgi:hypothetical protein